MKLQDGREYRCIYGLHCYRLCAAAYDGYFYLNTVTTMSVGVSEVLDRVSVNAEKMVPAPMRSATQRLFFALDRLSQDTIYQEGSQ